MVLYPEVQKKAREEIDRVVGSKSLPSYADRPNLPYVEALLKEVLRWNPVAPLGIKISCSPGPCVNFLLQLFLIAQLKMTYTTAISSLPVLFCLQTPGVFQ